MSQFVKVLIKIITKRLYNSWININNFNGKIESARGEAETIYSQHQRLFSKQASLK